MSEDVSIRTARGEDRALLLEFITRLQSHEAGLHNTRIPAGQAPCERYLDDIQARAADKDGAILVAVQDGRPAGFICFWVKTGSSLLETADSNRYGYVSDLYVAEDGRGRGLAARLLREAKRRLAEDRTVKRLRICTLAANALAVAAYESAGFDRYEITYEKMLG